MCEWGEQVLLKVTVHPDDSHTGESYQKDVTVDKCIAPIVKALNDAGILTRSCCCGHGNTVGSIRLHDGRELLIPRRD